MDRYEDYEDADSIKIEDALENYLQYHEHNNHEEQHDILSKCNLDNCTIFQRNYRNRSKRSNIKLDPKSAARSQILDKIHCFCYHDMVEAKTTDIYDSICRKYNVSDMFTFGQEFNYVDSDEPKVNVMDCLNITAKYSSLKEELVSNNIAIISPEQFRCAYIKAKIHYDSDFRKRNYSSQDISVQHLLSLLIYCNFDVLQFEFSKTYRTESVNEHRNFYHFGKIIKESVTRFGTSIKHGKIREFYHGINTKKLPHAIVGDLGKGIRIYCPLSTSSSFSVAMHFSYNGLIMTFGGPSNAKYFSVAWLSDFAYEREYLFLQNKSELQILNITDPDTNIDYRYILKALKKMDHIFAQTHYYPDNDSLLPEIRKIFNHQLQLGPKCDYLKQFPYANDLVQIYFKEKRHLTINYPILEQNYSDLFEIICDKHNQWIKIDVLVAVFPNINKIITNVKPGAEIIANIYGNENQFLFCDDTNCAWKCAKMTMNGNKSCNIVVSKTRIEKT